MGMRRRYSDDDRALALRWLAVRGGNVRRAAGELGIPFQTLHQWARGRLMRPAWAAPKDRPLRGLRVLQGLALPVVCAGEAVALDVSKLTAAEHAALVDLLTRARVDTTDVLGGHGRSS